MNFQTIKTNIISILATGSALLPSARQFVAVQAQPQKQGAKDINNTKKVVVFFVENAFDENSGTPNGEVQSKPTFRIYPEVSAKATATDETDPSTLVGADIVADGLWDQLAADIYQILMNATNMDLGMAVGQVANRFIKNIRKTEVNPEGENVVIIGQMDLTCNTPEQVSGETPAAGGSVKSSLGVSNADGQEDTVQETAIDVPTE